MSSSSLLFSGLRLATPSASSSASSPQNEPKYHRSSALSHASIYSRESWCSTGGSEVSIQGHVSHDQEAFELLVLPKIATNAIFGSTSPRKNRSAGVRSSIDSARSLASSSSSLRSPLTPETALFTHREHEVTRSLPLATIAFPVLAHEPKVKKLQPSKIVTDEIQYIGRTLDVPVSEDVHQELAACIERSASRASSRHSSARSSRYSTWNGKDGLKLAMDQLELELARTMVTLSASNSPASTISKSSGKARRRPHTADKVLDRSSARRSEFGLDRPAGSMSASPSSRSRFQRESWMSSSDSEEQMLGCHSHPIRFSASDLGLVPDAAEGCMRTSVQSTKSCVDRPVSHVSVASSDSRRAWRANGDRSAVPALVFEGRLSASSEATSCAESDQEAPSRPESFVTAYSGYVTPRTKTVRSRPSTARDSPRSNFYQLQKASRSTPMLATSEPPHEPLPPLPNQSGDLCQLVASAPMPPPRPLKSVARTPISSHRNSPVPPPQKALPHLPC